MQTPTRVRAGSLSNQKMIMGILGYFDHFLPNQVEINVILSAWIACVFSLYKCATDCTIGVDFLGDVAPNYHRCVPVYHQGIWAFSLGPFSHWYDGLAWV